MAYVRRTFRRRRRTIRRRTWRTRSLFRRRYRRPRRGSKSTKSAVVKLSHTANYSSYVDSTQSWAPFIFYPGVINGFQEYDATYSHFRLLKARMYINRDVDGTGNNIDTNYLVVGSRPFASTSAPMVGADEAWSNYVPPQTEAALRQSKWQRVIYPSSTRTKVSVGFYPYTVIGTFGPPATDDGGFQWQRIWEGRRWMPFTWSHARQKLIFFGPYIASFNNTNSAPIGTGFRITIELYCQFKGQK